MRTSSLHPTSTEIRAPSERERTRKASNRLICPKKGAVGEGTHLVAIGIRPIRDDGATEGDRCELGELGVREVDNVGELRRDNGAKCDCQTKERSTKMKTQHIRLQPASIPINSLFAS